MNNVVFIPALALKLLCCCWALTDELTPHKNDKADPVDAKDSYFALRRDLFVNYSADLRPVINQSDTVIVNVSLFVVSIHSLDERQQKLTISAWFYLEWYNQFLRWNASEYGGHSDIMLNKNDVWVPDLKLFNGYEGLADIGAYGNLARLSSDGRVDFEPGAAFEFYCLVDITYYPFDRQDCSIVMMFWMNRAAEADMRIVNQDYIFRALRPSGEWDTELLKVKHYVKGFSDDIGRKYAYVEYNFRLSRKRTFYVLHYLVPVTLLSLLNAIVFVLPPESGEKMSLSITVLLSFTLFIGLLNSSLPQTSLHVCYFAVYLSVLLGIGTTSVILSAVGLYLHYRHEAEKRVSSTDGRDSYNLMFSSKRHNPGSQRSSRVAEDGGSDMDCVKMMSSLNEKDSTNRIQRKFANSYEDVCESNGHDANTINITDTGQRKVHKMAASNSFKHKKSFLSLDPWLFDRVGFSISLLMTIGSTLTIIVLLVSV